jgi:hypothetical protein
MTSINSHIQPKYYLRGFLAAKENPKHADSLFVYKKGMPFKTEGTRSEKNPARMGLDNVAFVTNFYSFLKEDGTEDPLTYERRLEHEIESPGNRVLDKLRPITLAAGQSLPIRKFLGSDEQFDFARYISGMLTRTKRARQMHDDAVLTTVADTNRDGLSFAEMTKTAPPEEKERVLSQLRVIDPDFDEETGRFALPPKFSADFIYKGIRGEAYPKGIFSTVDWFSKLLLAMRWQIRLLPPAYLLPTGDEPVYWTDLREPNAVLLFPISSNAIFCAYNQPDSLEMIYLEENPDEAAAHAIRIFASKCQELYFSRQDENLVDLLNAG